MVIPYDIYIHTHSFHSISDFWTCNRLGFKAWKLGSQWHWNMLRINLKNNSMEDDGKK